MTKKTAKAKKTKVASQKVLAVNPETGNIDCLIGMKLDDAVKRITDVGMTCRCQSIDGVGQIGTCDFKMIRVGLYVEDELITGANIG